MHTVYSAPPPYPGMNRCLPKPTAGPPGSSCGGSGTAGRGYDAVEWRQPMQLPTRAGWSSTCGRCRCSVRLRPSCKLHPPEPAWPHNLYNRRFKKATQLFLLNAVCAPCSVLWEGVSGCPVRLPLRLFATASTLPLGKAFVELSGFRTPTRALSALSQQHCIATDEFPID